MKILFEPRNAILFDWIRVGIDIVKFWNDTIGISYKRLSVNEMVTFVQFSNFFFFFILLFLCQNYIYSQN